MDRKKIELKVELEDENKFELGTSSFDEMLAVAGALELPTDVGWKMNMIFYTAAPPVRVYLSYKVGDEDVVVIEKQRKEKYRHTLPVRVTIGPIPVPYILIWMQNSLSLVKELI